MDQRQTLAHAQTTAESPANRALPAHQGGSAFFRFIPILQLDPQPNRPSAQEPWHYPRTRRQSPTATRIPAHQSPRRPRKSQRLHPRSSDRLPAKNARPHSGTGQRQIARVGPFSGRSRHGSSGALLCTQARAETPLHPTGPSPPRLRRSLATPMLAISTCESV